MGRHRGGSCSCQRGFNSRMNRRRNQFGSGKVSGAGNLEPKEVTEAAQKGAREAVVKEIRRQAFANGVNGGDRYFNQNLMPNLRDQYHNEKYGKRTDNSERYRVGEHLLEDASSSRRTNPMARKQAAASLASIANRAIKMGAAKEAMKAVGHGGRGNQMNGGMGGFGRRSRSMGRLGGRGGFGGNDGMFRWLW